MAENAGGDASPEPWLDGVEGEPGKDLIRSRKRYVQVVAGPGSGKTFGLKRRVQRLVKGDGVDPKRIFVGTFTRAIRAELAAALAPAVSKGDEPKPKVETLHAQANEMLRDNPAAAPGRKFRFLMTHEESAMLYDIAPAVPEIPKVVDRREELRKVQSFWSGEPNLADDKLRGAVDTWLNQHGGMLIGEVVYLALNALNRGDLDGGAFDHVVVDEYQDLTIAEQQMVEKLCSPTGSLVVLGDDDQSIYRFRHNHPDGITGFPAGRDADDLDQIRIPENRRCGDAIVALANRMMAAAGSRKDPMIPKSGEPGHVDILHWDSVADEIKGLAAYMSARPDEKFLVLVPRQFIGYGLQAIIGDDASTSFNEGVLSEHAVRERFALAALLASPDDKVAVRAWIAFKETLPEPAPNRNAVAVASLAKSGYGGAALLEAVADGRAVPAGEGRDNVKTRAAAFIAMRAALPPSLESAIKWLFDPSLADALDDAAHKAKAPGDLKLLRDAALRYAEKEGASLESVLDQLRYRIATRLPLLEDEDETRIRIMTLHGSKGLEADTIVVAGLADEILPGIDEDEAAIAEQRRLLYVAVTRAKKHLVLSRPKTIPFGLAKNENVRVDDENVTKIGGVPVRVRLGASRFIPPGTPSEDGATWLTRNGVDPAG